MFEDIIGHEDVKKKITEDIDMDKISHAYLFTGIDGIGKKMFAIDFAKRLLGTSNLDTCMDFKLIQKLPDKKDILIEQVRTSIINDVHISPVTGKYKVYIIDDAHLMNSSSQNALLKTLEEPPKYVVIILITNNEKSLLTTVLSRVKKLEFNKLKDEEVLCILKKEDKKIDDNKLTYANGSVKAALSLSKEDEDNKYLKIEKLVQAMNKKDMLDIMKVAEEISFKDEETFNYLQHLFMLEKNYDKIQIVEDTKNRMKQNANEDIVKQAFIIRIKKAG